MKKIQWLDRQFTFGLPANMLPFFLERLEGTVIRLESKVKGISEEILSERLDEKWSIKQNIGHLLQLDEIALKRIDEMMAGISPISSAILELKEDYNAQPIHALLSSLKKERMLVLNRFKNLSDAALQKSAIHPRFKTLMSPVDLAWFHAEHDDHHLVRVSEIIDALS